jgi:predicted dehydrogenase
VTAIRIGVVGCGRIAQVMHLPFLGELPEFELVGLSDISPEVLGELATRYRGATTHLDYRDLLARDDVDAVAVTTPDHAVIAAEAARAGKHVFVEKPLCFTPAEGRAIAAAVEGSGVRLMVGYMRRYDPALGALLAGLGERGPIRLVRALDTLGLRSVPTDIYTLAQPPAGSRGRVSDREPLNERLAEGAGSDDPRRVDLYWIMLMLGVHDFAVLRAILGEPVEVTGTELLGGRHLATSLRYEGGGRALLELGVWPAQTWSDTRVDVVTDTATETLSFPNPWVRYLPTTLVRREATEAGTRETHLPDSYRYAFREEWLEFHAAVVAGREPATTLAHGLADVELGAAIVRAIAPEQLDRVSEGA